MRRTLNVKFLAVVAAANVAVAVVLFVLYGYQVQRHVGVLVERATRAEAKGELGKAAGHLRHFLALNGPDLEIEARHAILLARLAASPNDCLSALLALDQILRRQPEQAQARRWRARMALQVGQFASAREDLAILQKTATADGELAEWRGLCEEALGQFAAAAQWLAKAIERAPGRRANYVRLAGLWRDHLNDAGRADAVMDALVAANGGSYEAYLARAIYREKCGRWQQSSHDLARAYELAPEHPELVVAAAGLCQRTGDRAAARAHLEQGLRRHPGHAALYTALAALDHQAGRDVDAVALLQRGLDAVPAKEQADLLAALADLLMQDGPVVEAATVIDRLRRTGAAPPLLDYYEARMRMRRQEWSAAAVLLQRLRSSAGDDRPLALKANLFLGVCYEHLNDPDQELEAYRRAIAIDGSSAPARLAHVAALLARGQVDPDLSWVAQAQAMPDVTVSEWVSLARTLLLHNLRLPAGARDWTKVTTILDQIERLAPAMVDAPLLHAELLMAQGRIAAARALLEQTCRRHQDEARVWVARAQAAEQVARLGAPGSGSVRVVGLLSAMPGLSLPACPLVLAAEPAAAAETILAEAAKRLGKCVDLDVASLRLQASRSAAGVPDLLAQLEQQVKGYPGADQARLLAALAEVHVRRGDAAAAERLWTQLARLQPHNLGVHLLLFDLALQAGHDQRMQQRVSELRRLEGEDGTLWRYGEAARLVTRAKRGDPQAGAHARELAAELAVRREEWSRVPLLQGELAERDGQLDQAIAYYQRAVAMGERRSVVIQRLVHLLYQRGHYAAVGQLLGGVQEQTRLVGDLGRLAISAALRGEDSGRALALAKQAVADDPADYRNHLALGLSLWAAAQRSQAEVSLRRTVELANQVPETWVALVSFLALTDHKARAEEATQQARQALPPDTAALAQCYRVLGRRDEAEAQYQKALAAAPPPPGLVREVADFYLYGNQFARAEPHLRTLLDPGRKASPETLLWARRNLALGLAHQDGYAHFQEALALLKPNLTSEWITAQDRRAWAVVLAQHPSRRVDAIKALQKLGDAGELAPGDELLLAQLYEANRDRTSFRACMVRLLNASQDAKPTLLAYYARALLDQGDAAAAAVYVTELEHLEPRAFATLALKARLLKAQGQAAEAVTYLNDQAQKQEKDWGRFATELEALGQAGAAEKLYRKDMEAGGPPQCQLALAAYLGRQNRIREALDLCEAALPRCPPEQVAAVSVAVLHAARPVRPEDCRQVEHLLEAAFARHKDATPRLLTLAELRDLEGRHAEAIALYRQVRRQDGDNLVALNNLAWLLALRKESSDEAADCIRRAMARVGPVAQLLDTRAILHLAAGHGGQAVQDLEEAVAQEPTAAHYFHLAQAYWEIRNVEKAAAALGHAQSEGLRADELHPLERPVSQQLARALGRR